MATDNEPTPITGHGGVVFDANFNQQPSDGGKPIAEAQEPAEATSPPTITLRDEIYDFASILADLRKPVSRGGFDINPSVGIQIIATVLQNNLSLKQMGMMDLMPPMPDIPAEGDESGES